MIAYASGHIEAAQSVIARIQNVILTPLMQFMVAVAILYFLWGMYEFVQNADNEGERETGKMHMLYGIIGLLVILSAYAILKIAAGTFGCDPGTEGGCGRLSV